MSNYAFPTTIVDNFFDDPRLIREYALGLEYTPDIHYGWSGTRSKSLDDINKPLFGQIIHRFLSLSYDLESTSIQWRAKAHFQKIDNICNHAWVHTDPDLVTGIIYLNDPSIPELGTSIYESNIANANLLNLDKRSELYQYPERSKELDHFRKENNEQFIESIVVKNKFNRLIAFDSHLYHSAEGIDDDDTHDRLTLVFFIEKLNVDEYPLQRLRRRSI